MAANVGWVRAPVAATRAAASRSAVAILVLVVNMARITPSAKVIAPAETQNCLVPSLILQPLIENAIRHGIAKRARGGRVTVSSEIEGEALVLSVCDDGAGAAGPASARRRRPRRPSRGGPSPS